MQDAKLAGAPIGSSFVKVVNNDIDPRRRCFLRKNLACVFVICFSVYVARRFAARFTTRVCIVMLDNLLPCGAIFGA